MLAILVRSFDRPDELMAMLQKLGLRHVDYGARAEHYAAVRQALVWTLEQGLGEGFTPEVRDAWLAAYAAIAEVMQAAGSELRHPHQG
jgi:hemoglobin-like flavoprotein